MSCRISLAIMDLGSISFDWCTEHRSELTEKRTSAAKAMFDKHEAEQREKTAMARPVKGKEAW